MAGKVAHRKALAKSLINHCEINGDSRIHSNFSQSKAKTFRIVSSAPNIQNIVKDERFRRVFVPEPNCVFVGADFSQIQIRIIAHLALSDPGCSYVGFAGPLLNNEDIHSDTAKQLQIDRDFAKKINFSACYGMGAKALSEILGVSDCFGILKNWHKKYPEIDFLRNKHFDLAEKNWYLVSPFGQYRHFDERERLALMTKAFNSMVQMVESSIIKIAIVKIYDKMFENKIEGHLSLTVHDELLFNVKKDHSKELKNIVSETMTSCVELKVPLRATVKIGNDWYEVH